MGVIADVRTLRTLTQALAAAGYQADLREPDGQDALGGVIDIRGSFGWVQVISFAGRFPAAIKDSLLHATETLRAGSRLKIAPLAQLVALKLYAGGLKAKADVLELLLRNPEADVPAIQATCRRYRVGGLAEVLRERDRLRPG